jgi:plasmid replication initiation protein
MNNLIVYKSNKVIEAAFKLNLNEHRLILMAIGKVNPKTELLATDRFEVTVKEFAQHFNISEDKAYQTLKEATEQLFERYVVIDNPDPDNPTIKQTKTRWISSIDYVPDLGKVSLYFAQRMLPYLSQLKGKFTFYLLENISEMSSTYSVRLYELLMQWKTTGKREIEIDWLKKQFQIEGKYASIIDFKKRVIDPAVKDINDYSNYSVSWEQRKTGRKVTHLIFTFAEKNPPEPEQPPAAATPTKPPKAAITFTAEQQACFDWAKNQEFWQKYTQSKKSFLTCFNKAESGLKFQWLETLPKTAQPKKGKSAAALKKEEDLKIINLKNELANLEFLYNHSPNPAIAEQIEQLKQQLAEKMKKSKQ